MSGNELADLSDHVDSCTVCVATLQTLVDERDTFVSRLVSVANSAATLDVSGVVLAVSEAGGGNPIPTPNSPQLPDRDSDSRYQLQGEIARGGMGVVLKGRDTDLGRDLAIKVLLDSNKDKPDVIRRFVEEAQIGGQLQHPGIAPIYELGQFSDKRPFFSMKLVKGETLSELLAARKDPAAERSKFIGIFEQICQTMAYAHSRGVIHRDLKPANIMVGAFGEVQVMDWGLAKVLQIGGAGETSQQRPPGQSIIQTRRSGVGRDAPGTHGSDNSHTQVGSVMGTPAYMPPEQALGEIDRLNERSDVFGLGAILCEILTGSPPYVGDDATQVLRLASRGRTDDARVRLDACGADDTLVTLAKECLAFEPVDRPADAGALATRLTAYFESVEAKLRESELAKVDAQVRAEELRRRQKLALAAGTAIVITLVIGISASLWQLVRATTAEQLARDEAQRATTAEKSARDEAQRATAAEKQTAETLVQVAAERDAKELERRKAEEISTFLSNVMQSPDPTRDGREIKVVELLEEAARRLETDLTNQPARRTRLQSTLGRTFVALGLCEQAIPLQEQARDYYAATSGQEHSDTIWAMTELASSYSQVDRQDEALALREELLRLTRKVFGVEHTATLSAMHNLATSYHNTGRSDEALRRREKVLTLRRTVDGPKHADTLKAMHNLANSYHTAGRRDEALRLQEEVLTHLRQTLGPEHRDTLAAMNAVARSYFATGRQDEAIALQEETLPLTRKVLGPEHRDTLHAMLAVADSYYATGRRDEALALQEEAVPLIRKLLGPEHPLTLTAMAKLAISLNFAGRLDEAIPLREEVLSLSPKVLGPEHRDTLGAMTNLAISYTRAGRIAEAVTLQEQSLAIKRRVLPPTDPYLAAAINTLAELYQMTERLDEASRLREEVLTLAPRDPAALNHVAWLFATNSDAEGKYPNASRAVDYARLANELAPNSAGALNTLGVALYRTEQWRDASDALQDSIKYGADEPHNWLFIAMAQWHMGQRNAAKEWYDKSLLWRTTNQADAELDGFYTEAAKLMSDVDTSAAPAHPAEEAPPTNEGTVPQ